MELKVVDAKAYDDLNRQLNFVRNENRVLKEQMSKPNLTIEIKSDLEGVGVLKFKPNELNFSSEVQEAFIKYTKDLYKPLEQKIEKLKTSATEEKKDDSTKKEDIQVVQMNIDKLKSKINKIIEYCNLVNNFYKRPKYIKLIHSSNCEFYTNKIIEKLNELNSNLPKYIKTNIKIVDNINDNISKKDDIVTNDRIIEQKETSLNENKPNVQETVIVEDNLKPKIENNFDDDIFDDLD